MEIQMLNCYLCHFHRRQIKHVITIMVSLAPFLVSPPVSAQWIGYPTADVPRKADGAVDMAAPTPRMADGKPDFYGLWISDITPEGEETPSHGLPIGGFALPGGRYLRDFGRDLPGGLPYQDWQLPVVAERTANLALYDPHIRCLPDNFLRAYGLPYFQKFVHTPGLLVVLNERNASYRQIFTDGRDLPEIPTPSWQGYSSAHWSGDTLVVDTIGLRDDTWIDSNGSVITEAAKIREEFSRPDYGHLKVRVTVNDPRAYTKPWTVEISQRIAVDAELIDAICLENETFVEQMGLPF